MEATAVVGTLAVSMILVVVSAALLMLSICTMRWMVHAWAHDGDHTAADAGHPVDGFGHGPTGGRLGISVLLPCRDESYEVMAATVGRLLAQDHLRFEVIICVGDDDPATVASARRLAGEDRRLGVVVDTSPVKSKPRQLNAGLRQARYDVVGVIDAETLTAPSLLSRVDATFFTEGADAVQGAVHLINHRSRWFTLRQCLEYRIWFRSRLFAHAGAGFAPLGGNTVFVRRSVLEEVGGWDGDCLAEDADLGVRLSVAGRRIVCAYDAELTSVEEAPTTLAAFVRQRTRWSLGFLQVIRKRDWARLPTRTRRIGALWVLAQQQLMAVLLALLPFTIATAVFGGLPVAVALFSVVPLLSVLLMGAFELLILRDFGREMRLPVGPRDYLVCVVSAPAYQVLLAWSSLRSMAKLAAGDLRWEKTPHTGAHLRIEDARHGAPLAPEVLA